ncbi:hypothetical protein FAI41_03060 [Acetobacteraceae bacterium]|nr:hypothetical protein FAI41_03060 [Acetobacteraceae bacterium]
MVQQDNLQAGTLLEEDEVQEFSAWLTSQVNAIACARILIEQAEGDQAKICEGRSLLEFIEKSTEAKIDLLFERRNALQHEAHISH